MVGRPKVLTPALRQEILAVRKEGLSYSQIATKLKLHLGTVKRAFHEARKAQGYHIICLEVSQDITKEEALRRIHSRDFDR